MHSAHLGNTSWLSRRWLPNMWTMLLGLLLLSSLAQSLTFYVAPRQVKSANPTERDKLHEFCRMANTEVNHNILDATTINDIKKLCSRYDRPVEKRSLASILFPQYKRSVAAYYDELP